MNESLEKGQDFIVSALISELKEENAQKSHTIHSLMKIIYGCLSAILIVVGGFLWYLNQYDYVSETTSTYTSTGIYSLIDSEGNVIAEDLTAEEIEKLMEAYNNGESTSSQESEEKPYALEGGTGE